jgi:hypothetical protein
VVLRPPLQDLPALQQRRGQGPARDHPQLGHPLDDQLVELLPAAFGQGLFGLQAPDQPAGQAGGEDLAQLLGLQALQRPAFPRQTGRVDVELQGHHPEAVVDDGEQQGGQRHDPYQGGHKEEDFPDRG